MQTAQPGILYIAAAAGEQSGIHTLTFDFAKSSLSSIAFDPLPGAGYLILSPDGTRLYAAASDKVRFPDGGEVAAYSVAPDGRLAHLSSQPSGDAGCCHLTLGGSHLYCANYGNATVGEFRIAADGSLGTRTKLLRHEGSGVHPTRQTAAHSHFVGTTPDNRFLAVVDLGCDGVFFYPLDPEAGIPSAPSGFSRSAPGDGPRHLVFNAQGTIAYVANELANSVSVCGYEDGTLAHRQTVSTLPTGFNAENTVAAIRLTPDGGRLLVSNRGHDSIALFTILPDGLLQARGFVPAGGAGPRDFLLSGDARCMIVANERTDNVAVFSCPDDGGTAYRMIASMPVASRPIGVLFQCPCGRGPKPRA